MDLAITNNYIKDLFLQEQNFNINDFVLDDFRRNLDATQRTKETYIKGVKVFLLWCNKNNVSEVTHATLIQYKEDLIAQNKKANTISMYITSLKKLYKYLETKGIKNIASDLKGSKQKRNYSKDPLTLDQAKDLLNSIDRTTKEGKRNYALIHLLLTTGLRTIEIERANIEDIRNVANNSVLYVMGKGRDTKDEYVKLTYETLKAINEYLATRTIKSDKEPLFISLSDRTNGKRLKTRSIRDIIKKSYLKIGITSDKITTHSLRHTAITLSLLGGTPLQEVQQMARHSNINTTMIYAHNLKRIESNAEQNIQALLNS
jgi:site-specific recombinase XerD